MSLRTLPDLLEEAARKYSGLIALHQPAGSKKAPKYQTYTWTEYRDIVREVACGLHAIGLAKGDVVALDCETRAEFYFADLGAIACGCISAAMYTSLPAPELVRGIANSEAKAIFVEDAKTLKTLRDGGAPVDSLVWILLTGEVPGVLTLEGLREQGRAAITADPALFGRLISEIFPDDSAVLYVTSGATGEPKMGLTSHGAIISNLEMGPKVLHLTPHDSTLVFLPSAHIAQRIVGEFLPILYGMPVYFSEGLTKMPVEIRTIGPTFLLAPPRVWERIFSSISTEIKKRPAVERKLFYGALGLGLKAAHLRHDGATVPVWISLALRLADRLVFQKIRQRLGGRLRIAVSGAAPLGQDLAHFFEAIGLPLVEGYGLTEGGVVALNPIATPRSGSIGKALPGVEVKLADDGELLIKSPTLFSGYIKDSEATKAVLRKGWLHTGDIAEMDAQGYLYITGRKKELIVSSNGKKIYPSRIEGLFKMEPLVSQVMLVGDRQPYVTALFTVNAAVAESLPGMEVFQSRPFSELVTATPVQEAVGLAMKRVNQQLAAFEQIKRFRILDRELSIESGELTPTMKVRRTQVLENFRQTVAELYLGREEMT